MSGGGAIPAWVEGYIGLPWRLGGRARDGIDCWGLARLVWREQYGLELPACDAGYRDRAAMAGAIAQDMPGHWRAIAEGDGRPGDGLLLRIGGLPCHIAVAVGEGVMLHITDGTDSVIERIDGVRWRGRLVGRYRHG